MFDRVLNASLVYCAIAILHLCGRLFVLKLQFVCLNYYYEYSVTDNFLGILHFFLEWLLSKTSGDCFRFPLELLCLCFPCLISFKKYFKFLLVYVIRFWLVFRYLLMKNYLMVLKSQNFDFRIMFSYEINLKKFVA